MGVLSKIVLLVVVIFATTDISFAQSFSNTPKDTVNTIGILEDVETLSIQQRNISSNTIILSWEKVSETIPLLWEASVCDNQTCNTSLVDNGTMNPIVPTDYGFLLLHITPHTNYGTAIVRYAVWDIATPTLKDTLTYILTVNAPSTINETENKNVFSIFPNPATESIHVVFADNKQHLFEIHNSVGEKISSGITSTNYKLPVSNLNNGIYTISILSENQIIHTKKFLIQK